MKNLFRLLLPVTFLISHCATASATEAEYSLFYLPPSLETELALSAGPEHIRSKASVYLFGKSGYELARQGSNGMTCLVNRDGQQYGDHVLRPTCWDAEGTATILPVVLKVGELLAKGATADSIKNEVENGFLQKRFISPRKTGIAHMLRGDVAYDEKAMSVLQTVFPAHYMIYAPGVSNSDIGMTSKAFASNHSLPIVYDGYSGGARTAYIIIAAPVGTLSGHNP